MPNTFATLEEAQAEIVRLNEALTQATTERDALSVQAMNLTGDLERVRNLNQQYFLKLSQQFAGPQQEEEKDETPPSCEDFAKTLEL